MIFSVPLFTYEDSVTSLVVLRLLTLIISTIFSDSLYPFKLIWMLKPKTVLSEIGIVRSMGVGAQLALGGQDILPENICMKN